MNTHAGYLNPLLEHSINEVLAFFAIVFNRNKIFRCFNVSSLIDAQCMKNNGTMAHVCKHRTIQFTGGGPVYKKNMHDTMIHDKSWHRSGGWHCWPDVDWLCVKNSNMLCLLRVPHMCAPTPGSSWHMFRICVCVHIRIILAHVPYYVRAHIRIILTIVPDLHQDHPNRCSGVHQDHPNTCSWYGISPQDHPYTCSWYEIPPQDHP